MAYQIEVMRDGFWDSDIGCEGERNANRFATEEEACEALPAVTRIYDCPASDVRVVEAAD